jgi:hypothetical protein
MEVAIGAIPVYDRIGLSQQFCCISYLWLSDVGRKKNSTLYPIIFLVHGSFTTPLG